MSTESQSTNGEAAWNDPRVVTRARELCTNEDGNPCDGPGNDCDGRNCHAVKRAMEEINGW
jgi:hypothetical protein